MTTVRIQGAKDEEETLREKQEKSELIEVASQMDFPEAVATEIPLPSRDIINQKKLTAAELDAAEITRRETIAAKRRANVAKARERKSELARARHQTGHEFAQGGPAPDILTDWSNKMLEKMDTMNTTLAESFKSFPAILAQERNADSKASSVPSKEAPNQSVTRIQPTPSVKTPSMSNPPMKRQNAYMQDQAERAKRFKNLFDSMSFNGEPVSTTKTTANKSVRFF